MPSNVESRERVGIPRMRRRASCRVERGDRIGFRLGHQEQPFGFREPRARRRTNITPAVVDEVCCGSELAPGTDERPDKCGLRAIKSLLLVPGSSQARVQFCICGTQGFERGKRVLCFRVCAECLLDGLDGATNCCAGIRVGRGVAKGSRVRQTLARRSAQSCERGRGL